MRRCRKMISLIMLMVMLVSLLPTGAMAAEAPTGATNEVASVEEPQGNTDEAKNEDITNGETDKTEDTSTDTSDSGAKENDGTNDVVPTDGTTVETTDGDPAEGTNTEDAGLGNTSTEDAGLGNTSTEIAAVVEPVDQTAKNEEKSAGTPVDLAEENRITDVIVERKPMGGSTWSRVTDDNPIIKDDGIRITIFYRIEGGILSEENNKVTYQLPTFLQLKKDEYGVNTEAKDPETNEYVVVGSLDLTTYSDKTVHADITYFKDYVKNGNAVEGKITYEAITSPYLPPYDKDLEFLGYGDDFKIDHSTFRKTGVKVNKKCSADTEGLKYRSSDGAYLATYTLEVSSDSEDGTYGLVDVVDTFTLTQPTNATLNHKVSYEAGSLVVKDGAGKVVPVTADQVKVDSKSLKITGLPKLNKGEKYIITYDVAIIQNNKEFSEGASTTKNVQVTASNKVTATSEGKDKSEATHDLVVLPEFTKGYDTVADRQQKWTVRFNRNASHSMDGYTYTDTMTEGMYIMSDITITGADGQTDTISIDPEAKIDTFSYTFKKSYWGDNINKQLIITYTTNARGVEGGSYSNTGEIIIDTQTYKVTRTIGTPQSTVKAADGYCWELGNDYTMGMNWKLNSMELPETMNAGDSHTYEDTLYQTMYTKTESEYVEVPTKGEHYTYCSEIYNALNKKIKVKTTEGYYKFEDGKCMYSVDDKAAYADSSAITFTLTGYDAAGKSYSIVANKNDSTTKITRFRITVKANKNLSINNCTLGGVSYTSYYNYGKANDTIVNDGTTVYFFNRLRSTTNKDWTSVVHHGWRLGTTRSKSSKIVEENGKVYIDYTVLLHYDLINLGGEVVFTDQRSFDEKYGGGYGTYVDNPEEGGPAKAELWSTDKNGNLTTRRASAETMANKGYFSVDSSRDSEGILLFKFDVSSTDAYNDTASRVKLTYRVRVDNDEWWNNIDHKEKVYDNTISDIHGHEVSASTPYTKTREVIEKTGEQVYVERVGNPGVFDPTGRFNYSILINKTGADLDPEHDTIVLTDTMNDELDVVEYDSDSLMLYYYDKEKGEKIEPAIDREDLVVQYDRENRKLTVELNDATAYVLEYSYKVAKELMQDGMTLENTAELMGHVSGGNPPIVTQIVSSEVTKRELTFYKVDEKSDTIRLDGAKFDLEQYDPSSKTWNKIGDYTTTGGKLYFDIVDLGLKTDVGYRLIETEAPNGYSNLRSDGTVVSYYFVIQALNETKEQAAAIVGDEIASNSKFFSYYGGEDSIKNRKIDTVSVTVNKKWEDLDNVDNTRPDAIKVQLYADGKAEGKEVTIKPDKNGKFSYTWKNLKKNNASGSAIKYTVSETKVLGYENPVIGEPKEVKDKDGNVTGYTIEITNKLTPKTEVPVEKIWHDTKNQHDSVTVKLYANNTDTGKTLELNETNGFKGKFTDLTKYDTSNKEIVYTVKEEKVDGYATAITGSASEGFKITNTILTNIAVEKIWDDANDQDGKRPATLKVNVTKNGTTMTGEDYEATLNKSKGWKHTWSNLPAYDEDGKEITYSVTEALITGYTAGKPVKKSETTDDNGVTTVTYTITNTYSPGTVNAKVKKIWVDDKNADGLRTSIEVQLTKNGTGMGDAYKQTLNKDNDWEYEWTGLPANDAGVPITYSVMEITQVNGYTTSKPAAVYDEATKTWNISVTNTHDRILIDIPVEKVWRDDKTQHDSITVKLLKGGEDTGKTLELNEANGFKGKFTGLPKFENEGKEIEYTIEEVEVTGYTTAITGSAAEGFKITNTILTNIAVEKVWDDSNDQDRKRPTSITVHLTKNGTPMTEDAYKATLKAEENWKGYTWSDLPAYDEDGKKITYSVKEDPVAEYTAGDPVKAETTDGNGVTTVTYSIKNSYTPGTVHAKVVKKWEDNNDQDGLRTSIEVELTKNGKGMGDAYKKTLNEANNWTYEWSELPENTDGVQNTYSIVEISTVTGYEQTTKPETSYDEASKTWNISVTNTHTPIKTEASVKKVWDDGNNIEGLQPKEIKVQLLDVTGDKEIPVRDEVTLNAENEWTYTWTGLDKFKEKGTEIKYTVREVSVPEGYTDEVKVAKDLEGKFKITVTNRHGGRPVSISKTDITNGKEVEGATLQILLNNEVVTAKDEKGKDARAEWTSTKEPHKVYGLTPGVTYTLRETIQPEGFTIIEADTTFSVDKNGIVTATGSKVKDNIILVEDAPTFVKVKKVDATSQEEVEGAHIQILDGDEVFDEWDSKKGVVHEVKYLVADKKYTLRETVAPLGYTVISDTEFTVNNKNEVTYKGETVSETIDGVPVILVEDTMTIVKISKTDITGDKELKGATLQILDDKGEVVTVKDRKGKDVKCEWVSTDEPHVVEGLEINKTYTLRETISPDGYTIATDATFSIDEKNKVTYSGKKNSSGVLLVQDEPTKLYVSKQAVTSDEELPGATLQILDEEENVVVLKDNDGNPVETLEWVSGEKPKYIEGLPTGVNYILRETISPDGYTIASDTKFTIDEKGVVTSDGTTSTAEDGTTVLVVKDDFTTVQISKVDTESGAELEGAKLQIIDEENNIVEEWTSTKEVHVVRGLVANKKYILREQVAPLGYTLTTDTTFSIDMHNVVTSTGPVNKDGVILVNDTMTEVEILKVDSKTGKGLAGAKLQVLDDNGAVCDEWTSTKDAHKIKGLYTGVKYTLHEVEAPKGYDKAKDITFTIDTAGKVSSDALDNGKIVMKDTPTPSKSKNKTGDEANGALWALLLMMAGGALGGTVWFRRKRRA